MYDDSGNTHNLDDSTEEINNAAKIIVIMSSAGESSVPVYCTRDVSDLVPPTFNRPTFNRPTFNRPTFKSSKGMYRSDISEALLKWLDANRDCPYPTEGEKLSLSNDTGLDLVQINNWMSNARRRKLKLSTKYTSSQNKRSKNDDFSFSIGKSAIRKSTL